MKRLIKLFPVALGLLALASCSNDEFAGGEYAQVGGQQLIANLEASNEAATRAAIVPGTMSALWQKGDQFRVYDANLQKYDIYECDGSAIALKGSSAKVEAHAKALFPGKQVFYAGYDDANDDIIAVMSIPNTWKYGGQDEIGGTTGYVGALPMWGDVKAESAEKLEVDLKYLTAYTDITVYKGFTSKIRVIAAAADVTEDDIKTTEVGALAEDKVDATTPLSGYFEAQLKDGGVLKKTNNAMVAATNSVKPYVEVTDLGAADESHVYIPIIPATYKNLMIQYWDATASQWKTLKAYKNQAIARNTPIRKDLVLGTKPTTAVVSSLKDLNDKLALAAVADGAVLNVSIKEGSELATTETLQTLDLGNKKLSLTIDGAFKNSTPNLPLTITNAKAGSVINAKIEGTEAIVLDNAATNDITLVGSANSTGTAAHKLLRVKGAGDVKLGNGTAGPFSTDMNVVVEGANLTVDAYSGTIAAIDNADKDNTKTITIKSGTVTAIGGTTPAAGNVTVNGGTVNSIATKAGTVTVAKDATVTNVTTETGAPSISSALTSLTTKAATATIAASVTTATFGADATVTLTGSGKDDAVVKITTLDAGGKAVKVNSTGKSAIMAVKNGDKATFKSDWSAVGTATDQIQDGNIYTAAQLAGIKTGTNYTLNADITTTAEWTPVNLNGNFTAVSKSIEGLDAPLFNKISGGVIGGAIDADGGNFKPFTLKTASIAIKSDNLGILAKEVSGTTTIQNVTIPSGSVASTNEANSASIGGLVGTASGTVTLLNVRVGTTTAVDITGYKNVGGFIGSFGAGTLNIQFTKAWTTKSKINLDYVGKVGTPAAADAGTFGNFVGSVTGAATVNISKVPTTDPTSINSYFATLEISNPATANTLHYAVNKNASNKAFIGMQGNVTDVTGLTLMYEIGRSTGSSIKVNLYGKTEDDLGNPFTLTEANINQYE